MKTTKMSLANIQGKLSRTEMKNIMAGSGGTNNCGITCTTAKGCKAVNKGDQCENCTENGVTYTYCSWK